MANPVILADFEVIIRPEREVELFYSVVARKPMYGMLNLTVSFVSLDEEGVIDHNYSGASFDYPGLAAAGSIRIEYQALEGDDKLAAVISGECAGEQFYFLKKFSLGSSAGETEAAAAPQAE